MKQTQKITAHVPVDDLRRARAVTGKGITETVRRGLAVLASAKAAEELRRLRGTVRLDLDVAALRRELSERGVRRPLVDTVIAQSCLDYGLALATRDGDFETISMHCGLEIA